MRILVTGKGGQLTRSFQELVLPGIEIVALGRPDLDITHASSMRDALQRTRPDIVVNAAAYTAVDRAEDEPEQAFLVNATGAGNVAMAAANYGVPIVQISTDYVFAGTATQPYRETDEVEPLGVYGRSKYEGERAVAAANPDHIVLRTAWVHSAHGANFVQTMLRLARDRETVAVVADQNGTPTYAPDLARGVIAACLRALANPDARDWRGAFHLVSEGATSWAGFATEIFVRSAALGGPSARVDHITTSQYPTRAKRPAYSVLDMREFRRVFGHRTPAWQDGVARCVTALLVNG